MNIKSKLFQLVMMGNVFGAGMSQESKLSVNVNNVNVTPKTPPLPKGCQYYHFNNNGGYENNRSQYTVFSCIALNYNSARKKFNKWESTNK